MTFTSASRGPATIKPVASGRPSACNGRTDSIDGQLTLARGRNPLGARAIEAAIQDLATAVRFPMKPLFTALLAFTSFNQRSERRRAIIRSLGRRSRALALASEPKTYHCVKFGWAGGAETEPQSGSEPWARGVW